MIQVLQFFFTVLPWALALLIPLVAVTTLVVGRRSGSWWVAVYFVLIFYFPNASYGLQDAAAGYDNFYARATGTFYFSAINIMLFGLVLQAFFARRFASPMSVPHNLRIPGYIFAAMLVGNLVVGLAQPDLRWFRVINYSGLLNIANFMFAFYVLVSSLRDSGDVKRLVNLMMFCTVTRGVWGLTRFVALGGDPANFYANFQHIDVRITFFDINDGLLAMLALWVAAWRLSTGELNTAAKRALHWGIVGLQIFIIVFSYRRTGWAGLALGAVLFALCQSTRLRWSLLASYAVIGLPVFIYESIKRGGSATRGGSLLERVLPDIVQGGSLSFTTGRFAELYAAWLTIKNNLLLGVGAWGRYDAFRFSDLAWHRGDYSWMHSGMLHVVLKTGLIGGVVVLAAIWLYYRFVRKASMELPQQDRGYVLTGAAGALFMLPTWAIGTPVIEFRTMQLLALCFALPYLSAAAARAIQTPQRQVSRVGNVRMGVYVPASRGV